VGILTYILKIQARNFDGSAAIFIEAYFSDELELFNSVCVDACCVILYMHVTVSSSSQQNLM
jgi:hypothetical protein